MPNLHRWSPALRIGAAIAIVGVIVGVAVARPGAPDCPAAPAPLASSASGSPDRLNLILIVVDDQRFDQLSAMPNVQRLLTGHGVAFVNAFVTTSLCCPSRASILSGQYSRHTGVFADVVPLGGAPRFHDRSTLATWLHSAGYTTALVGKYMNEYLHLGPRYVPPGWDEWDAIALNDAALHYYDYPLNENGSIVHCGGKPSDYSTTVLSNRAVDFIRRAPSPFFLYYAPIAPHLPATAAPGDSGGFTNLPPYRPPSFNQADVSREPWGPYVSRLGSKGVAGVDTTRTHVLQSLQAVDRSVAAIASALKAKGVLNDTVIAYTSDNGFLYGEHRMVGKIWPFEESIRVPLVIRVPWARQPRTDSHLALNIDLASTFARLGGVKPELAQDGRSLVPLLHGRDVRWRTAFTVEYLGRSQLKLGGPPPFEAVRTLRYLYAQYTNGWRGLYDLRTDPNELTNLASDPAYAELKARLTARLRTLLSGSG